MFRDIAPPSHPFPALALRLILAVTSTTSPPKCSVPGGDSHRTGGGGELRIRILQGQPGGVDGERDQKLDDRVQTHCTHRGCTTNNEVQGSSRFHVRFK